VNRDLPRFSRPARLERVGTAWSGTARRAPGAFHGQAAMTTADDILAFWFPPGLDADEETHRQQFQWWFGGGADEAIIERYRPVLEAAAAASCMAGPKRRAPGSR